MRQLLTVLTMAALLATLAGPAMAAVSQKFDFDTLWSDDYAPGWENTAYRHGTAPVGKMMVQVADGRNGTAGMKLVADSTPQDWMWWASVSVKNVPSEWMLKQYNPWISVWYKDAGWESGSSLHAAGQLMSVPDWVNPYIPPGEDWTDIQFGARMNQPSPADNYYYVAAGEGSPGWVDTKVDRANGWVNLKMQLSATDGKVHFFVDGVEKGASYRADYTNLGTEIGLYTMFTDPLSGWGVNKPSTIWDDFEFGSELPEPSTLVVWSLLGLVAGGYGLWRRKK